MTTLSLDCSRRVFELIGMYETESLWASFRNESSPEEHHQLVHRVIIGIDELEDYQNRSYLKDLVTIPAPTFAELIRVLPRIGEKKGWEVWPDVIGTDLDAYTNNLTRIYQRAPTEPEGMAQVEKYLMNLI